MKKILAFITVMAIIFSFAIPSYADYINETATIIEFDTAETAELSKYSMVLDEYFNMRKNQFLRETDMDGLSINPTGLTTDIVERQADREKFISEWKDELRISITDTAINYCIKGEVENNSQDVKLLVYEWVWINYSDHMGLKDVMGFGTDHIISVSSTDGAYFVNSDSYIEITGYTDGNSYDIGALNLYMQENENNFDPEDFRGR